MQFIETNMILKPSPGGQVTVQRNTAGEIVRIVWEAPDAATAVLASVEKDGREARTPVLDHNAVEYFAIQHALMDGLSAAALTCDLLAGRRDLSGPVRQGVRLAADTIRTTRDDEDALRALMRTSAPALLRSLQCSRTALKEAQDNQAPMQPVSNRRQRRRVGQ